MQEVWCYPISKEVWIKGVAKILTPSPHFAFNHPMKVFEGGGNLKDFDPSNTGTTGTIIKSDEPLDP